MTVMNTQLIISQNLWFAFSKFCPPALPLQPPSLVFLLDTAATCLLYIIDKVSFTPSFCDLFHSLPQTDEAGHSIKQAGKEKRHVS